jgi:hypothetical protein
MYSECPKKYELFYKKRLREKVRSGALVLGSALDEAFNHLLLTKDLNRSKEIFVEKFTNTEINKKQVYVPECPNIVYAAKDLDLELITNNQLQHLKSQLDANISTNELEEKLRGIQKQKSAIGWKLIKKEDKLLYNLANYYCLVQKGLLILEAYNEKVIPKIVEVISVQHEITMDNNEDVLVGIADFICKWETGETILFDNKSSSSYYEDNSVKTSQQLTLYDEALKQKQIHVDKFGFIVGLKDIPKNREKVCVDCGYKAEKGARHSTCFNNVDGKRCGGKYDEKINPKAEIQIIIDTIPETHKDLILTNVDEINHVMKQGVFTKNLNHCKQGNLICPYYNYCWSKDDSDLEDMNEQESFCRTKDKP